MLKVALWPYPIEQFSILDLRYPLIDASKLHTIRRTTYFEALEYENVQSGKFTLLTDMSDLHDKHSLRYHWALMLSEGVWKGENISGKFKKPCDQIFSFVFPSPHFSW